MAEYASASLRHLLMQCTALAAVVHGSYPPAATDSGKMPDTALPQLQPGSKGEPVDYASILSGTRSRIDYGTGSLLPFVGRPWSMNNWALQTNNYAGAIASPLSSWWYHPEDREAYGIRCTHQASPWIYDYGEFLITPAVGVLKSQWPDKASKYNRTSAIMKTFQLNTTWQSYCSGPEHEGGCLSTALTATERAALLHIRFPPHNPKSGWEQTRHLRVLIGRSGAALTDNATIDMEAGTISGYTRANSGGVPSSDVPASALAKQTHRIISGLDQCPDTEILSSFSLHFHLDGDLGPDIPINSTDLMAECATACCGTTGCNAWRINLDRDSPTCSLGQTATIKSGDDGTHTVVGWKRDYAPVASSTSFAHYFYMELNEPLSGATVKDVNDNMYKNGLEAIVSFPPTTKEITIRIGTSFISRDQAKKNLAQEIPDGQSFQDVSAQSRAAWNEMLSKAELVDIGNTTEAEGEYAKGTWYTNLFRAAVYPRMFFEHGDDGRPIHFSAYDPEGGTFDGRGASDSGFWDAYRTVYPLNSLLHTKQWGLQMEGWLNAFKEGGWLPSWSAPGDRGAMTGNMQDASIADAIVKRKWLPKETFNASLAWEAVAKDAYTIDPKGRKGLALYEKHGYIPIGNGIGDEVSATLNYNLADYSMSLAASELGYVDDAKKLYNRSKSWRYIFDKSFKGGFMRPKYENGSWLSPFDEFAWEGNSGEFTEAAAWQYRFYVPHEPHALAELYGSDGEMCAYLSETMTGRSIAKGGPAPGQVYHNGQWGLHHEQVEMVENCFGQYEHNNQPVWHQLWMFAPAGCPATGQRFLRAATSQFYGPEYWSGDEDNGSMAAWYVLSAMGLYQLVPGSLEYSIGSPMFRHVKLSLDNGNVLHINAPTNSAANVYVASVSWNGATLDRLSIGYDKLMGGGTLLFEMTGDPKGAFVPSLP